MMLLMLLSAAVVVALDQTLHAKFPNAHALFFFINFNTFWVVVNKGLGRMLRWEIC